MGEPTLVIVSGLPGSGKTTLARELARERPGIRFSPDEWMQQLGVNLWDGEFRDRVERLQETVAAEVLRCGGTAIVEWGTWAREERDRLLEIARRLGARAELVVLDPPVEELWRRVVARGLEDPPMTRDYLESAYAAFQRPDDGEAGQYDRVTHLH